MTRPLVDAAQPLVAGALAERPDPLVVAIDGRSGSGKSTLARDLAEALRTSGSGPVTVIEGDDFYRGGTAAAWDARAPDALVDGVIDWPEQRRVLGELRAGRAATYRPFDWESPAWEDDAAPHGDQVTVPTGRVVILEGAYSARPELDEVVDLRLLLDVPPAVRAARLRRREAGAGGDGRPDWDGRWARAEDRYFGVHAPAERFDLVLHDAPPTVTAIHVAPATRLAMRAVVRVEAEPGKGLVGDRYHGAKHRHVTVQSQADLDEAAAELGHPIPPASTRRNITISHGAVPTRPGERLRIGDVDLEVVRVAAPCKLLDDGIAPGARLALRRRAGTVFRVLAGGPIAVGDAVDGA